MSSPFNPLDKLHLGESVRDVLLRQSVQSLPPVDKFPGAGVYALYYTGDFPLYRRIAERNLDKRYEAPIYIGKAVPAGARKGGLLRNPTATFALWNRLNKHAETIRDAQNLRLDDFAFRALVVDDIWIPLGEALAIEQFQPLWNVVLDGFGIHDPGGGRELQRRSKWDTLHPGRRWVESRRLPDGGNTTDKLSTTVAEHLARLYGE